MYCKNCGSEIDANAAICVKCGFAKGTGTAFCANCGKDMTPGASVCTSCGVAVVNAADQKSKLAAGLLGIFLGGFGVHNFYLGYTGKAIAQLLLSLFCFGIGGIWALIEGILILCGNIDKDASGTPLKD